jgi:hypothetical protein
MQSQQRIKAKFNLGNIYTTPGAFELLDGSVELAALLVQRHAMGDWGDICLEDVGINNEALKLGGRLLSVYKLPLAGTLWIITEADRASTTLLLPEEY